MMQESFGKVDFSNYLNDAYCLSGDITLRTSDTVLQKKNWLLTPFLNPANVPVSLKQV